jgi:hypothetical protein
MASLVHEDESFYVYQPVFVGTLQRRKTSIHSMYVIFFLFAICQQTHAAIRKDFKPGLLPNGVNLK